MVPGSVSSLTDGRKPSPWVVGETLVPGSGKNEVEAPSQGREGGKEPKVSLPLPPFRGSGLNYPVTVLVFFLGGFKSVVFLFLMSLFHRTE